MQTNIFLQKPTYNIVKHHLQIMRLQRVHLGITFIFLALWDQRALRKYQWTFLLEFATVYLISLQMVFELRKSPQTSSVLPMNVVYNLLFLVLWDHWAHFEYFKKFRCGSLMGHTWPKLVSLSQNILSV